MQTGSNENNIKLRQLIKKYHLRRKEVAALLGMSSRSVDCWLSKPESKMYRQMSNVTLELLMYKIEAINNEHCSTN